MSEKSFDKTQMSEGKSKEIFGVVGIVNFNRYLFLIAVTKGERVANCSELIYLVKEVELICFDTSITSTDQLPQVE